MINTRARKKNHHN